MVPYDSRKNTNGLDHNAAEGERRGVRGRVAKAILIIDKQQVSDGLTFPPQSRVMTPGSLSIVLQTRRYTEFQCFKKVITFFSPSEHLPHALSRDVPYALHNGNYSSVICFRADSLRSNRLRF